MHCYLCVCENEMNACENESFQLLMYNTLNIPTFTKMLTTYVHTHIRIHICVYMHVYLRRKCYVIGVCLILLELVLYQLIISTPAALTEILPLRRSVCMY